MLYFSHLNSELGAEMVSIANKNTTKREAVAMGYVYLPQELQDKLHEDQGEYFGPKGAILQTANLAGILAAKKTAELIPLCHNIPLDKVQLDFTHITSGIKIQAYASSEGKTGVEMEALCAVSIAALTIYDMCKALSNEIRIENIHLIRKIGGKQDYEKQCQ